MDDPWPPAVLDAISERITGCITPGRPALIGIDGPSGAGKSTLAADLALILDDASVLPLDRIYPGWDGLEAGVTILAEAVLPALAQGQAATYPRWDWRHNRPLSGPGTAEPAGCVIVEGVGSCARRCAPYLSLQIWVDAPEAVRHQRAMARDGRVYRPHWERWAAQERAHFRREGTRQRAHLRLGT